MSSQNAFLQGMRRTYSLGLEALDQDAVEEGNDGLDRLESRLSSLKERHSVST